MKLHFTNTAIIIKYCCHSNRLLANQQMLSSSEMIKQDIDYVYFIDYFICICLFELLCTIKLCTINLHFTILELEYWQSQEGPRWALCKFAGAMFKLYQSRSNFKVNVTFLKSMVSLERSGHKKHICQIWTPSLLKLESYDQCSKVGQRSRSRSHVHYLCYNRKGLVIRNAFTKDESLIS